MKLYLHLTKNRIRSLFSSMLSIGSKRRGGKPLTALGIVGVAVLLVILGASFLILSLSLAFGAAELAIVGLGSVWFYFTLIFTITFAVMIFAGSLTAKAQLFSPKDNDLLLSMPIPPRVILLSRMTLLYVSNLLFSLLFLVPAVIIYLLFYSQIIPTGVVGVIGMVLAILLLPLMSVTVSSVLGWVIAWAESKCRNKTTVQTVISVIFFGIYMAINMKINELSTLILTYGPQMMKVARSWLFVFYSLGAGCAGDLLMLVLACVVYILPFLLCLIVLERTFVKFATAKKGMKKVAYSASMARAKGTASPLKALTKKEIGHFFSNGMYIMNAGIGLLFMLVGAVALPFIVGSMPAELKGTGFETALPAIALAASMFFLSTAMISAPSVSLEAKSIWIPLTVPVPSNVILRSKSLAQLVISAPPVLLFSLSAVIFIPMNVFTAAAVILLPQVFSAFMSMLGTVINTQLPKFDWVDEIVAIKQSGAVGLTMLISMVALLVIAAPAVLLGILVLPELGYATALLLTSALTVGLYFIEEQCSAKRFAKLGNK